MPSYGGNSHDKQRGQSCEALECVWVRALGPPHESSYFVYWAVTYNFMGGVGHSHKPDPAGGRGLSRLEVAALVLGCLIPLVLSIGHQH